MMNCFRPVLILLFILSFQQQSLLAQGWAVLNGEPSIYYAVSMSKGQGHPNNTPGMRRQSATWMHGGKLYLYGGAVKRDNFSAYYPNDMWVFDTTNRNWTFLSGTLSDNQSPVYGTKGIASPSNNPGRVEGGMTWVANSKLYFLTPGVDMWSYDPASGNWTLLSGQYNNRPAVYGTTGIAADTVRPGNLSGALTWEHNGKLYLYGGYGHDSTVSNISGALNDIWEFDLATNYWKWIKGSRKKDAAGNQGTINIPAATNMPRGLNYAMWYLNSKIYLSAPYDDFIWEYDQTTNNWTYVRDAKWSAKINYGTKGIADTLNSPGPRTQSATWVHNGKMYLYGGHMFKKNDPNNYYKEDLWELDPVTKYWTWVAGDSNANAQARYGVKGYWNNDTWPGPRMSPLIWRSNDRVFLMSDGWRHNDEIWEYNKNTKEWRWIKGMHNPASDDFLVEPFLKNELNEPGLMNQATRWQMGDTIYVYGHNNHYNSRVRKNILWRYEIEKNVWTPIKVYANSGPVYGIKGHADRKNNPGIRYDSHTWVHSGMLYLYGGDPHQGVTNSSDDLWEFDPQTNNWRWIKGDTIYKGPTYGTKGVSASGNTPGTRMAGSAWYTADKFYLFGGRGEDVNGKFGAMNDLWELDMVTMNWRWLKGSNQRQSFAEFGTKGVAALDNTPGAKEFAAHCTANNKLYLFGGRSYMEQDIIAIPRESNDFWEYDPATNNWCWLSGDTKKYSGSTFGTKGIPAPANSPGRKANASMVELNGKIYLHGGWGSHEIDHYDGGVMDDLWEYNPGIKQWAWIDGSKTYDNQGYYNLPLTFDVSNQPGASQICASWAFGNRLYFFGGVRYVANVNAHIHVPLEITNALWCYDLCKDVQQCYNTEPLIKLDSTATMCDNRPLVLNAGNVGCSYLWSTSDTTQSIQVSTPGTFWVKVTNPAGKNSSDTIIVLQGGSPVLSLISDTLICAPDSVVINTTNSAATYHWSTGDTTAQPIVRTEGIYSVLAIDTNGCYNKDSVFVDVNPRPAKPKFGSNSPLCTGDDLYLVDSAGIQGKPYIFGRSGLLKQGLNHWVYKVGLADSGKYYLVDSLNGCWAADTTVVRVDSVFTPTVTIGVSPQGNLWPYVQAEFTAVVNYGRNNSHLQWYKNGVALPSDTETVYKAIMKSDIADGDIICVGLKNNSKCALTDTASYCLQPIILATSAQNIYADERIRIYPNPANDVIIVDGIKKNTTIRVFNIYGVQVLEQFVQGEETVIDINNLAVGTYLIRVGTIDNRSIDCRFTKL